MRRAMEAFEGRDLSSAAVTPPPAPDIAGREAGRDDRLADWLEQRR